MIFRCECGKQECNESAKAALRFKIFNEGTKNTRQKMMAKAKMKPKGSMTDIAKKLGIKIEEDLLAENTLVESKEDQQKFIDKFGKENFDIFWNNKQRLKNKDINVDILWHVKHTSLSDMHKIIDSISDEQRAQEVDVEGAKLPTPTGNFDIVFENDEYVVYNPHDYISSLYCAKGGRWCTAGGCMIDDGQVKVSQAKTYFNQYTDQGVTLYYFIRNNGERYALALYPDGKRHEVFDKRDNNIGGAKEIPGIEDIEIEGLDIPYLIEHSAFAECTECGEQIASEADCEYGPDGRPFCKSCFYDMVYCCNKCYDIFYEEDIVRGPDDNWYCEPCARDKFITCDYCSDYVEQDSCYWTDDGEAICDDCFFKEGFVFCEYCGTVVTDDNWVAVEDEPYCEQCVEARAESCPSCGALVLKRNMVSINGEDPVCLDCAPSIKNESFSRPMKFRLVEDIAAVRNNYPKISDEDFDRVIKLDPTFVDGRDSVGTYGKWLLNLFNKGKLDNEGHARDLLTRFESDKKYLKNKDIGRFKSLEEVDEYLNDDENYKDKSHRQEVRDRQKDRKNADLDMDAEIVYKDNFWTVWTPKTYAASCKLGQGSSWCTASTESDYYYNYYTNQGPLYIVINNSNEEEKYQFHFPSGQFMDIDDHGIELMQFLHNEEGLYEFFKPEIYGILGLEEEDIVDGMITAYIYDDHDYKDAFGDEWLVAYELSHPDGDPFDIFSFAWDYPIHTDYLPDHEDLPDDVKEEFKRLGIDDYKVACDEYSEIGHAVSAAAYAADEAGAMLEAREALKSALEDAGAEIDAENGIKIFVTKDEFESHLDDYFTDVMDYQDVVRYIFGNKIDFHEPYYGWQGFDEQAFFDELLYQLAEIEEL